MIDPKCTIAILPLCYFFYIYTPFVYTLDDNLQYLAKAMEPYCPRCPLHMKILATKVSNKRLKAHVYERMEKKVSVTVEGKNMFIGVKMLSVQVIMKLLYVAVRPVCFIASISAAARWVSVNNTMLLNCHCNIQHSDYISHGFLTSRSPSLRSQLSRATVTE